MRRKKVEEHVPMDVDAFKEKLKALGMKATPQRVAVHEAMVALVHASADMVAEHIAAKGGTRISVASVYNILSGMADLGIYSRRSSQGSKMWFDVNSFRHLHAFDTESETFTDIFDDELVKEIEGRLRKIKVRGYKIERADIQLTCKPKKKRI